MKHVALSLLAAACGTLTASALDATNARIWLDEKVQPDFASVDGSGISSEKHKSEETFARTWQYVSIPVHVEGKVKGGTPHYISELKVRISLAMETVDDKGKVTDEPELLSKEITYVDIPLSKKGDTQINVGVFVSPSNAYKLSGKDGSLEKRIIAVAVEGTFDGANCNREKEKAGDKVSTDVILNAKVGKGLSGLWWKGKGGKTGAVLSAISETPFAHKYAGYGFPATNPVFGAPAGGSAVSSAMSAVTGAVSGAGAVLSSGGPVGGPVGADTATDTGSMSEGDVSIPDDDDDSSSKKGKKSKKAKKARR